MQPAASANMMMIKHDIYTDFLTGTHLLSGTTMKVFRRFHSTGRSRLKYQSHKPWSCIQRHELDTIIDTFSMQKPCYQADDQHTGNIQYTSIHIRQHHDKSKK